MAKHTFASDTFASWTFLSGAFNGVGAEVISVSAGTGGRSRAFVGMMQAFQELHQKRTVKVKGVAVSEVEFFAPRIVSEALPALETVLRVPLLDVATEWLVPRLCVVVVPAVGDLGLTLFQAQQEDLFLFAEDLGVDEAAMFDMVS